MALTLYYHPLSSYCWKALIALFENDTAFTPKLVDFSSADSVAGFRALWPMAKMPVLADGSRGETIPEASIIVEYLSLYYPGPTRLLPQSPEAALEARLRDRFYDLYVHAPMQKIVGDRIRQGQRDPEGVAEARRTLRTAYGLILGRFAPAPWAAGEDFGLADCAAAPALYYADKVEPFGAEHSALAAFLERLKARPAFARVLVDAEPYFGMFPAED